MCKRTRFVTLLGLLLVGGAINAHAQMGQIIPQNNGGSGPPVNNGDVNTAVGGSADLSIMDSHSPTPKIVMAAMPEKLTDFSTASGKPSAAKKFTLSGNAANAGLTAPQGFEISLQEASGYASSLKVEQLPSTIWVRLTGSKPDRAQNLVSGDISMSGSSELTGGSATVNMRVEGVVN